MRRPSCRDRRALRRRACCERPLYGARQRPHQVTNPLRTNPLLTHSLCLPYIIRCLDAVVEPGLKMGIMPSSYDSKILFDYVGPAEISGPAKKEVDAWAKLHLRHPRTGAAAAGSTVTADDQRTLLNWIRVDAPASVRGSTRAAPGRPKTALKIGDVMPNSSMKEYTIAQLRHNGNGTRLYLRWLCGPTFTWSFPRHEL